MSITRRIFGGTALAALMLAGGAAHADDPVRIALVVKALGIGFFEAANDGAMEAAQELGNVEIILVVAVIRQVHMCPTSFALK